MSKNFDVSIEKQDQILRGKRIKYIRENELKLNKTDLAKQIGVSSQFLGLVEEGKSNLTFRSIKLLRNLSGHSADYIIFGLDDTVIDKTQIYLQTSGILMDSMHKQKHRQDKETHPLYNSKKQNVFS